MNPRGFAPLTTASARSTLPMVGPGVIAPAGIDGVRVGGSASGALVNFRWPDRYKLAWISLTLHSADPVELANTLLLLEDGSQHLITLDGQGLEDAVPMLALTGLRVRRTAFDRLVQPGELWTMQIVNNNAGAVVPRVYFGLEVAP